MDDRVYNFGSTQTHEFFSDALSHENLWIGRGYWNMANMYFDGAIDEVMVFDHPLSAQEVTTLYNEGNIMFTRDNPDINKTGILLYPNPASTTINIDYSIIPNKSFVFEVYNVAGELVFQSVLKGSNSSSTTIDLSTLPKGQYIYSVLEDSRVLKTDKLVLQ